MRKIVFTSIMNVHDDDFNSEDFQSFIKEVGDSSEVKKYFKGDFPKSEIVEINIVVS